MDQNGNKTEKCSVSSSNDPSSSNKENSQCQGNKSSKGSDDSCLRLKKIKEFTDYHFALFNVMLTLLFVILFFLSVCVSPYDPCPVNLAMNNTSANPLATPQNNTPINTQDTAPDTQSAERASSPDFMYIVFGALATFFTAGALGGAACNLRAIFKYNVEEGNLPPHYLVPFYVRPWMGGCSGLITLFVLGFLNTAISGTNTGNWTGFFGRIPYIGIAFLAGFASQEFLERLKEIAKATFGMPSPDSASVWRKRGLDLYFEGKYSDAVMAFEEALRLDPKDDLARRAKIAAENAKMAENVPDL